jgi:hypothetical protein
MKLPKEYKKFIGKYDCCTSRYGRKMLRKFGYGPETEVIKEVVEEVKPKKTKKKKTTK